MPVRSTCCWSAPSGSTTPASATRCCRGWPRPAGCWWSTRRTASPTGATTSGPTTAGSAPSSTTCPTGIPVLATTATANQRVTDDVAEQLGADDARRCAGSLDRESLRLGVVRLRTPSNGWPGWPTTSPSSPGWASSTASPWRRPRRSPATCAPAARRSPPTPARPSRPSGSRLEQDLLEGRVKALVATSALGHGLRRLASASWSTSGHRSRRWPTTSRSAAPAAATARGRVGGAAARHRGPRHLGLLRLARLPARAAGARDPGGARRPRAAVDGRAGDPGRALPQPARDDAQGARRRRRRTSGARRLGGHRPGVGLRRGALRRVAEAREREQQAMLAYLDTDGCRMGFLRAQLDDPAPSRAAAATTAAAWRCRRR